MGYSRGRERGRAATTAVIPGRAALSIGRPPLPEPRGWTWTKLTDVAALESGHTPSRKHPEYWGGDIPWIGVRDATGNHGRVLLDTAQHTNDLGLANSSARLLPESTVCLSRTASVGYVVVMGRPMATSQDFVNWVCDDEFLDWRYLKYVLESEHDALRRFAYGTTHQTIYFPEVKAFHVLLPTRGEQARIASVIAALDRRVEHNEQLVQTARLTLKCAFDHAVRRNRGKDESLASIAHFVNGGAFTKGADGQGRPVLRIRELNLGGVDATTVRSSRDVAEKHLARDGDVLFSWSGTLGVYRWFGPESIVNQHIFKVVPTTRSKWEVELWIEHHIERFRRIAADKAVTMGHIRRGDLAEAAVGDFRDDDRQLLDALGFTTDALRDALGVETLRLRAVRDQLLPKLVSAQIRVPPTADESEAVETLLDEAETLRDREAEVAA